MKNLAKEFCEVYAECLYDITGEMIHEWLMYNHRGEISDYDLFEKQVWAEWKKSVKDKVMNDLKNREYIPVRIMRDVQDVSHKLISYKFLKNIQTCRLTDIEKMSTDDIDLDLWCKGETQVKKTLEEKLESDCLYLARFKNTDNTMIDILVF